jgi:hypothetical protein
VSKENDIFIILIINDLSIKYTEIIEKSNFLRISFRGAQRRQGRRPQHRRVKKSGYGVQTLQEYH